MANKNYQKGAAYERKIVNQAKAKGFISFRSAGSHSPIDVVIIDPKDHRIFFIQAKKDQWNRSAEAKEKLLEPLKELNGIYSCSVELL